MSLDPQLLHKMLMEMDSQLNRAQAELSMCNVQLERADTNIKIVDSTQARLAKVTSPGDSVWQGVGRAFVRCSVDSFLDKIAADKRGYEETRKLLKTKQNYLETTLENTVKGMQDIVGTTKP